MLTFLIIKTFVLYSQEKTVGNGKYILLLISLSKIFINVQIVHVMSQNGRITIKS